MNVFIVAAPLVYQVIHVPPRCTEAVLETHRGWTAESSPIQAQSVLIDDVSNNSSTRLLCDEPLIYRAQLGMSFCQVVLSVNLDDS